MDPVKLQQLLDETFDHALLRHGFVDHMRDYQLVIHMTADPIPASVHGHRTG
ncbi:YxiG-like protein [Streptosporangium sandarakinum]|uniref:YxiG-like protein n=1 Tax=Streptosporangium sandarakinum TaxID=1260955 RepID=UPI0033A5E255